jgi:hypothetical protein
MLLHQFYLVVYFCQNPKNIIRNISPNSIRIYSHGQLVTIAQNDDFFAREETINFPFLCRLFKESFKKEVNEKVISHKIYFLRFWTFNMELFNINSLISTPMMLFYRRNLCESIPSSNNKAFYFFLFGRVSVCKWNETNYFPRLSASKARDIEIIPSHPYHPQERRAQPQ